MTKIERDDALKSLLLSFRSSEHYKIGNDSLRLKKIIYDINKLFEPITYIPFTPVDFNEFMYKRICMKKDKERRIWIVEGVSNKFGVFITSLDNDSNSPDRNWNTFEELLNNWQFEDGTPFGKQFE